MSIPVASRTVVARNHGVSLKPKEHGAYAILGIPLVVALLVGGVSVVGLCIALASIAGFFAHEPLLVALGHRGRRAQRETPEARSRWMLLFGVALASGATAMALGPMPVRIFLFVCLGLAGTSFGLALAGKHRSLAGQLWGVFGLTVPCVPILIAGDRTPAESLAIWTVWILGFASTTLAVRAVIASQKRDSVMIHWLGLCVTTAVVAVGTVMLHPSSIIATFPMLAASWYLILRPPPAKQLKRVGWCLVASTLVTAAIVVIV